MKRAKVGDYRVQHDFGGHLAVDIRPTDDLIDQARRIVESVDQPLLYARVDGVTVEETLVLMELELIEPFLFFSSDLDSVIRFGNALTLVNQAASSVANKNCLMAAS